MVYITNAHVQLARLNPTCCQQPIQYVGRVRYRFPFVPVKAWIESFVFHQDIRRTLQISMR